MNIYISSQGWSNIPVIQIQNCTVPNPTMHHFVTYAHVCTFLLQNGALWDICLMHCGICNSSQGRAAQFQCWVWSWIAQSLCEQAFTVSETWEACEFESWPRQRDNLSPFVSKSLPCARAQSILNNTRYICILNHVQSSSARGASQNCMIFSVLSPTTRTTNQHSWIKIRIDATKVMSLA